jgi:DNA-binding XRE family transcriptional regulator
MAKSRRRRALPGTGSKPPRKSQVLPNHIRERRVAARLTQQELAEDVGVAAPTLSTWETGKLIPSDAHKVALCKALNCGITELFDWGL